MKKKLFTKVSYGTFEANYSFVWKLHTGTVIWAWASFTIIRSTIECVSVITTRNNNLNVIIIHEKECDDLNIFFCHYITFLIDNVISFKF